MPDTGYTVASAATLLGAKPPKRREIEDVYLAQMSTADERSRKTSSPTGQPEVTRTDDRRKVRFSPSTVVDGGSVRAAKPAEAERRPATEEDRSTAVGRRQAGGRKRAATTGVAEGPSLNQSRGPSNTSANTGETKGKATSPAGQEPHTAQDAARLSPSKEGRALTQPSICSSLPFAPSHRFNANPPALHPTGSLRVDTSGRANEHDDIIRRSRRTAARYNASASAPSSSPQQGEPPSSDIYFTPIDVNRSTIEFEFFNAPMTTTPRVLGSDDSFERGESSRSDNSPLLARGGKDSQCQYQHARKPSDGDRSRRRSTAAPARKDKITVSPEQLDRLIVALANAPLVQNHLRKQWLEDDEPEKTGNPSLLSLKSALRQTEPSDSTPSLTNNSTASDAPSDSSSALYSRANSTFVHDSRPASPHAEADDATAYFNEHPLARLRPRARFGGIALIDAKVHGAPIRFISKGYKKGANVLQVGSCSFLNVPYGASVDCILRVEPGDVANGGAACSVTVQVMAQVLERKKGRKVYLLVAELEVTESLTKAVLVELARHTGMSLEDIEVVRQASPVRHDSFRESVDWCALADELHTACSTNDILADAADAFKGLDAETCSMQTLTLLSELERIKAQHVDFLVLRSAATSHRNGMPTGITVPWISQHLDRHVNLWSPEASCLFREDLVAAVGKRHLDGEPFAVQVLWGRKKKIVRCVPLLEGDEGRTAGWVAFIGDEFNL